MTVTQRPNILFLLSDEHSFRCLSCLDPAGEGEPVRTPTLDGLARQGVRLAQTYCQVPLCTPSRICMLTGMGPMGSGGWDNGSRLRPEATVPSLLADAGYATCLLGKMHLGGDRQFVGFQHRPFGDLTGDAGHQWEPLHRRGGGAIGQRIPDAGVTEIPESLLQERIVATEAVAFLREQRHRTTDQPWMLCASFSRPHFPLTAPRRHFDRYWPNRVTEPKVGRTGDTADHPMTVGMARGFKIENVAPEARQRARAGYFACVDWLDEMIGDLLATLDRDGLLDNTIIVYTSDHGELAGEHGMWWKNSWHEAAARVPWIIQLPEHRRGELPSAVIQTPVSLADLLPTLCGLAGVDVPDGLDGVDLSTAIRSGAEPDRGPVWFTNPTARWGEGTANIVVRDGRHKYVRFEGDLPDLLFDLDADPLEQRNLAGDPAHADVAARLGQQCATIWDFDAADRQRKADKAAAGKLPTDARGNLYHMPDGRLIRFDDTMLFDASPALENPSASITDWPGA